jgi:hypothetical protein
VVGRSPRAVRQAVALLGAVLGLLGLAPAASAVTSSSAFACSPVSVRVGQPTTCTVTVTGVGHPTGTVAFASDSSGAFSPTTCTLTLIGGNQARCRVTYTPTSVQSGLHHITATYSGDPKNTATQYSTNVDVQRAATTTTVSCPAFGEPGITITCTATVTGPGAAAPPTGQIAWGRNQLEGSFGAPTCTLIAGSGGSASCSIDYSATSFAPHKIYANYLGDADHVPSNSAATVIFDT